MSGKIGKSWKRRGKPEKLGNIRENLKIGEKSGIAGKCHGKPGKLGTLENRVMSGKTWKSGKSQ
jgi:hypothetical protein